MQTIRGRFDGSSIELLEDAPIADETYVLVTFLDSNLGMAAARGQRLKSARDSLRPPHIYSEELRKQMASQYRRYTIGSIMTRRVISVLPSTKVSSALHIMRLQGITSVLVEPGGSGEWGIMTMRDLLKRVVMTDRSLEEVEVSEVASRPLITVSPDMSLLECSKLLVQNGIRRVVVKQNDQYVGIVSDTDIFQTVEEHGWGSIRPEASASAE
jgi:isocitrate dehydrogenase